ncbi:MAG: 23S rRNA (adenine(2503)-C(2))-methyltransferase RlmN [Candidatus Kerfeldbacteria bacterium]|nr:23S rRNA (adenine(2503)-C(2))-methyltransferase RlmN [Candidatus Kerfeldbacteria bacterium]
METTLDHISETLQAQGQPRYRINQVRTAWFTQPNWDSVTTLSKQLRQDLAQQFSWLSFPTVKVFNSPKDSTQKAIITLADGQKVETVNMPNSRDTRTVCVSSQVGCGMGCTFCATGTMGLKRNLTVDEIVDQVRYWRWQASDVPITNVVFMGMGEPLANSDAVKQAINILINDCEIGKTRIVLSTVAFPGSLKRLVLDADFPDVRLAISLHAGTDETRGKIVPSHKRQTIQQIKEGIEAYLAARHNRRHHVTLEYVMLLDVNDMPTEAEALAKTFKHLSHQIKVNLIPWNQTDANLQRSSEQHMIVFQDILEQAGIPTTIRYSKGLDISAACGQLVVKPLS